MSIFENQTNSERRIMGIPILGLPSLSSPFLRFDPTINQFVFSGGFSYEAQLARDTPAANVDEFYTFGTLSGNSISTNRQVAVISDLTVRKYSVELVTNAKIASVEWRLVKAGVTQDAITIGPGLTGFFSKEVTVSYLEGEDASFSMAAGGDTVNTLLIQDFAWLVELL